MEQQCKDKNNIISMKRYTIYLIRWQLSTPVIYLVMRYVNIDNTLIKTILANLIGGLIFYWIDKVIFRKGGKNNG